MPIKTWKNSPQKYLIIHNQSGFFSLLAWLHKRHILGRKGDLIGPPSLINNLHELTLFQPEGADYALHYYRKQAQFFDLPPCLYVILLLIFPFHKNKVLLFESEPRVCTTFFEKECRLTFEYFLARLWNLLSLSTSPTYSMIKVSFEKSAVALKPTPL